ncbi:sperm flagellar protein 2 isoform X2 [Pelodiscus sinensis]|uniref:sperm flagellar protein 2 isoform X2 n=1 Tax=Pelodiscus sinensis TaxID=13735 RepID=UPI0003C4336D|nr:sperm flagellar protein 2 isoform X2 [Pelodiscus sinensis]|eukprot:XP_006116559.1 sperm flagellar protein 2 isoform X2 [Pelodiscus sinensis]
MSEILCEWLNGEVKLSRSVDPKSLPKEFSTGYLIGEILHKYELQDDFNQFSQSRVANSKLNNFSRLEPTLQLLGVQFDQNEAQNIMTEQHGAATKLLYQLYVALEKKKKAGLTGVAMETMRPAGPAKLKGIESELYRERLRNLMPRQTDLRLQEVSEYFEMKSKHMENKMAHIRFAEQQKVQKIQEEQRAQDIEKHRKGRRRQNEIMARIQAAIIQIPKPPPNRTLKAMEAQKMLKKKKEAQDVYMEIKKFEKFMRKESPTSGSTQVTDSIQDTLETQEVDTTAPDTTAQTTTELLSTYSDDEYTRKIQKRLEEDSFAREQREKRRRKMLMEQLIAHEAQEEAYREDQLINRLMRQSQQERRIAVQLMHVRHEKEVLWQNRIFREKQYEERRLKEFQEALDREAALAKQEKIDYEEQICKERELHKKIAAERAEARYKKHYSMCWEVIDQIIDLSTKTGEYRMLTNNLIPIKLMRDWKELFFNGKPIYEQASLDPLQTDPTPEQLVELDKMNLLDEKDYDEYKSMIGEWCPPEEHNGSKPPSNNNILGHVIYRLMDIVYPPKPEPPTPVFPPFPIQGCVLGKLFSGKSTCVNFLEKACNIQVLSIDTLVQDSIKAFHESEMESENNLIPQEVEDSGKQNEVLKRPSSASASMVSETVPKSTSLDGTKDNGLGRKESSHQQMKLNESKDEVSKLSVRASLGAASEQLLKKGKNIPDELLVDIMVEAIKQTPQKKGWIMDGFPMTINQAKLLEKALTGRDPDKAEMKDEKFKKSSLLTDPAAPKEPPFSLPAFDFALLLDISDTTVLERMAGMKDISSSSQIQLEDSNQTSDVELKEREKIDLVGDQIQHRIAGFLDNWPKLEKWFSVQQNILVKVNGETEKNLLCKRIKEILLEEIVKKQNKRKELEKKEAEKKQEDPTPFPQTETLTVPSDKNKETESASEDKELAKSKSPKEPLKKSESFKDKKGKKEEASKGKDAANKPGSVRGKSPGKMSSQVTPEDLPPLISLGPSPIKPGSDEWIYVDEPLPKEIPEFLIPYWEMIENAYENTIKTILRYLRQERYFVIHYLADTRNHFKDYLRRPDHKQEFVSQWQSDYNSIADDLWEDEETKAELHQRVTDLRDRLWDICENRREEAEQERSDIMNDGWLPDHMGILMNHFFSLMQVEVDRFQDTMRFLHDYYRGMEGKMPTEACREFSRIPLLDIVNVEQSVDQSKSRRIPMVPRKAPSPEINITKQKSKAIQVKSNKENSSESITFNFGADEKIITDTWQAAVTAISNMVNAEIQSKEAEEEKERQQLEKKEQDRQKPSQAAGGKGGGKDTKDAKTPLPKSPNKKKGAPSSTLVVEVVPILLTPEELKKQELKLKMKQEYFSALEFEEEAAKSRLQLIKTKALAFVEELAMKAEETYKYMEKWLGARFLAEMSSVDKLTEIARHHIECSTKIPYELVLDETDFFINNDVKVIPDPIPPPRPPPVETSVNGTLTISQLSTLHKQFLQVAPKAIKALKHFKGKNIPPNKNKDIDEGKERQYFEHQAKGNHQFLKTWLTKYPWLKYDGKKGIMFCALCRKHNVNLGENIHNFCSGSDIFKLEFINIHQSSEAHAWASCMEAASNATGDQASTEQMLKSMSKVTLGRIENIFRTCHAIAKCGRPFTDIDWMCKLDDMKGVDIGSMFRNGKSARTFIHYIAEVERRALKEKLEKCKFFSLISDGVADNAIKEAAVVYVRFAYKGKVHCQIVGVQSVDKSDASTVKNAIVKTLQINLQLNLSSQDWSRKLVGFGSDGAEVMVGENNGVAKLLKEIQPCVQSVHCFAHRLELAYKEALKSIQLYTTLIGLLQNIYYFYHNSPLNKTNLKSTYETLKLRPAIPSRIGGTRWLSRLQTALQILLKSYPAILLHMSKLQGDPSTSHHQKVKGLLKLLLKMEVVKFSHFLLDIINVLNILSRVTQDRNSSIADIFSTMQSTLETLQMYKTRSGPKERLVETVTHFHGHQLVGNGNILPVRTKVLSNLVRMLRDCFCDASQDVLRATTIGSFKLWPEKIKQEFGEREVSVLTKHYEPVLEGANVKVDEVDTEWSMLKLELYDRFQNIRSLTWDSVNSDYLHKYPNILMLVDLILALPASSAEAERGFSQMKLIMMQMHSKGMSESMTDLMVIQLNSPDIKTFDPEKAIYLWNSASQKHRLQTGYMITNGRSDCSSDSDFDSHCGSD